MEPMPTSPLNHLALVSFQADVTVHRPSFFSSIIKFISILVCPFSIGKINLHPESRCETKKKCTKLQGTTSTQQPKAKLPTAPVSAVAGGAGGGEG